jgi:mRNA interferase MazF
VTISPPPLFVNISMTETDKPALAANDAAENNDGRPPRITPRIKAAPSIRQVYWCDFWTDAHLPEMWKRRPVIILSFKNSLSGICTVIACSTDPQEGAAAQWGHKLSLSLDGRETWVVCNHIYTVATSRLHVDKGGLVRLKEAEFNQILTKAMKWLPRLPEPQAGEGG